MKVFRLVAFSFLIGGGAESARYQVLDPEPVPVAILVKRTEAFIKDYPKDPQGPLVLGRIHSVAFKYRAHYLDSLWKNLYIKDRPPRLFEGVPAHEGIKAEALVRLQRRGSLKKWDAATSMKLEEEMETIRASGWKAPEMTPSEALKHFTLARDAFERALKAAPVGIPSHDAQSAAGLASLWQSFSDPKCQAFLKGQPDLPSALGKAELADLYYEAFRLSLEADLGRKFFHGGDQEMQSLVSYRSGEDYLTLTPEGAHADEVRKHLDRLRAMPRN